MTIKTGGCACGKLRFSVDGDAMNSAFCYCTECQAHTGSDKWFGVWFAKDVFKITSGVPTIFTRDAASGHDFHYLFCSDCGTTIGAEVTVANFYSLAVTSFDQDYGFKPNMAIYCASAPKWAVFPDGVPKFDQLPPRF